jgi:hypothetical protein
VPAAPLKLQQIISREEPLFDCQRANLTIGRDEMVYLRSAGRDSGYILRVSRDGSDKLRGASIPAIQNATADAGSRIAAAHAHFSYQVAVYDRQFQKTLTVTNFLVNNKVAWDTPASVEAGESGDFYALDQHRDRILRLNADGKTLQGYPLPHFDKCPAQTFRVCEETRTFYLVYWGNPEVQCLGFDGKLKWQRPLGVGATRLPALTLSFVDTLLVQLPAAVGHSSARKEIRLHPHEWPEKEPGVKKKRTSCGLNPIFWRFAAEVGVTAAGKLAGRRSENGVHDGSSKRRDELMGQRHEAKTC